MQLVHRLLRSLTSLCEDVALDLSLFPFIDTILAFLRDLPCRTLIVTAFDLKLSGGYTQANIFVSDSSTSGQSVALSLLLIAASEPARFARANLFYLSFLFLSRKLTSYSGVLVSRVLPPRKLGFLVEFGALCRQDRRFLYNSIRLCSWLPEHRRAVKFSD